MLRQRWMLFVVFFVLLFGWLVQLGMSPLEIRDDVGDASIYFSASDPVLLSTKDCYTVRWNVTGIEAVYLNEAGQIGQGEKQLCYQDGIPPQLRVVFEDDTEKTYEIDVELIIDMPQFWLVVIVASILLRLVLFVDESKLVKWIKRVNRVAPERSWVWAVNGILSIIFISLAFLFMPPLDIVEHSDSRYYLELAQNIGVISFLDWEATRPPVTPIIYSILDENVGKIAIAQFAAQVISWLLFAWTVADLMTTKLMRIISLCILLGFALSATIFHWWNVLLTESLTLSVTIFGITIIVWFIRYLGKESKPIWQQIIMGIDLLIVIGIWLFLRDINFYAVILLNVMVFALILYFRVLRQRMLPFLVLVMLGSSVLAFFQNQRSIETDRWQFPLTNVIVQRILQDKTASQFFIERDLPITDTILDAEDAVDVYAQLDDMEAFDNWLDEKGRGVYISYLLQNPLSTIWEPIDQRDALLLIDDDLRGYSQIDDLHPIQSILTNLLAIHGPHLYGLSLAIAIFAGSIALSYGIDWRWLLPLILLGLVYPLGFVAWHGDSVEVERHSLQVAVFWRLGFWLLVLIGLDSLLYKRHLQYYPK